MPDPKPDPKSFAKNVLWQLAGVQASLQQIEANVAVLLAGGPGEKANKILDQAAITRLQTQTDIFRRSMADSGIDVFPPGDSPEGGR